MQDVKLCLSSNLARAFTEELHAVREHKLLIMMLKEKLSLYAGQVNKAFEQNEFIDTNLATILIRCAYAMLEICNGDSLSSLEKEYVLASISYLITPSDNDHDFESILGLEDDGQVIAEIFRVFDLQGRVEQIDPTLISVLDHPALAQQENKV